MKKATIKLVFLMTLASSVTLAQENVKFGLNINKTGTGSGAGLHYSPGINVCINKVQFVGGINIAKKGNNLSGVNFEARYMPRIESSKLKLFFNYTSIINTNIKLSSLNAVRMYSDIVDMDKISDTKVKVIENYVGFGLERFFLKKFSINASIGAGTAQYLIPDTKRFYNPSVLVKLGLNFYSN